MIGDEAGILTAGGATEAAAGTAPADEAARTGVPVGSPFADAAGARLLTTAAGRATATMTIPAWLAGPTPGGHLGTAAVAALAEIAMGAAGNAGLAADELTQTAALQLHTRGPAEGWPGLGAAAPAVSVFVPAQAAGRTRPRQVELRAEARVQDTEADEAGAPLRRVTATVSTPAAARWRRPPRSAPSSGRRAPTGTAPRTPPGWPTAPARPTAVRRTRRRGRHPTGWSATGRRRIPCSRSWPPTWTTTATG
ncbi:hypothetical protein I6A60_22780 [Frankia sp. AgB1.9]|uniref:hypothetical protein n=1 Tax=Frankia sp. AgB1.9 TaxID=1836968 RepID=UPI0019342B57|nr:hypothetical protein [Frankia sp. AgB1.9]MBL7550675.1 hypothetical protein [Frankia sp. AgB1.9]